MSLWYCSNFFLIVDNIKSKFPKDKKTKVEAGDSSSFLTVKTRYLSVKILVLLPVEKKSNP